MSTLTSTDRALHDFAAQVGAEDPIAVEGNRTRWHLGGPLDESARIVKAPTGIVDYQPSEMVVTVRAGTTVAVRPDNEVATGGGPLNREAVEMLRSLRDQLGMPLSMPQL